MMAPCMKDACGGDVKAIAYGLFVTLILSATMVVAGLKAGITPGVSPLVVLCGWGAFRKASRGPAGSRFLNLSQVAGSAGMAIVSGVIFSEPLLQVMHLNFAQDELDRLGVEKKLAEMPWGEAQSLMAQYGLSIPEVDVPVNIMACLVGSLIGWGFVGLTTRKFLSDPTLPAPEATACVSMIEAAVADNGHRPRLGVSLMLSIVGSFVTRVLALLSLASSSILVWSREGASGSAFELLVPFDSGALYLGIGALLTVPTALLTFTGSFVRLVGDFLLAGVEPGTDLAAKMPANSMRWVGGGAMTVAVAYSLARFLGAGLVRRPRAAQSAGDVEASTGADSLLDIGARNARVLAGAVAVGALGLAIWLFATEGFSAFSVLMVVAILVMASLMVPLGAILSLQIGGSCSPVSGTVFVTTLVLCLVALATGQRDVGAVPTITTLLVAACVAVCSANDVSQDYKTLQLCGVAPREGFLAQILGLLVGSIVVPLSLYVADSAYGLGTDALPAPQGKMFATLVQGLLIEEELPWYPILIGVGVGACAVVLDYVGGRLGVQMPAMSIPVGLYLGADTGIGILIGSAFRFAGERMRERTTGVPGSQTHECILAAAGMITGGAFLDLLLGVAILFGFDPATLSVFSSSGADGKLDMPLALSDSLSVLGLLFLGWVLLHNSLHGSGDEGPPCKGGKASCSEEASAASSPSDARVAL
ncbi:unnamed protein product [Prorocentrum cordatum]|uniref:H(+)-exporting diphosphatase n=1 Tax=Prorocentrum cordatum TaxID=2364126 RepID=A0ABN9U475_9DINO|nr:unnamed protein product [Polarella glacialis]